MIWSAEQTVGIIDLLEETGLVSSRSHARRMVGQGAVQVDQQRVGDVHQMISIGNGTVVQVGRRKFVKLVLSDCDSMVLEQE